MILQISVENFRSVDQEQTLNLYTMGHQGGHQDNVADLRGVPYRGLKTVGIYGANGSGKSNFLRAVTSLVKLVSDSYRFQKGDKIPQFDPCLFHESKANVTSIEIVFTMPDRDVERHYIYQVRFNATQIERESLMSREGSRRPFRIFVRYSDCKVKYGDVVKGRKAHIVPFHNQLFLSVAGQRAEAPEIIVDIATYIRQSIVSVRPQSRASFRIDDRIVELLAALQYIDIGVAKVGYRKARLLDVINRHFNSDVPSDILSEVQNKSTKILQISHKTSSGVSRELDLDDESDGTQRFAMFLPAVANVLLGGGVLLFDELEAQMHPFLAEVIVKLFNDSRINKGQAQLIYTTHCTNLLSETLLRRDQIWFTEKVDCRTRLFSLDDFDKKIVTPYSPYIKWYLDGRFGGVPTIDYGALVNHFLKLQSEA